MTRSAALTHHVPNKKARTNPISFCVTKLFSDDTKLKEQAQLEEKFQEACEDGNLEELNAMLANHSIDLNMKTGGTSWTPLHILCFHGHVDVIRSLLEQHGRRIDANVIDSHGSSPLHLAVDQEHFEVVECLLQHHKDVNIEIRDRQGCTPLHCATSVGDLDIIRLLIVQHQAHIDARDRFGSSPLHCAAETDQLEVLEELLEHGADINHQDNDGNTALHIACRFGNAEIADCLLQHGACKSLRAKSQGKTPLWYACMYSNMNVIHVLLRHGVDVNEPDHNGHPPWIASANPGAQSFISEELIRNITNHRIRQRR